MDVKYLPDIRSYSTLNTEELRGAFLIQNLFQPDKIHTTYFDIERAIVGGAVPVDTALPLLSSKKEMAAEFFAQRREIGAINVGGDGKVKADDQEFRLGFKDCVYIGRGTKEVVFSSLEKNNPAHFYFVSYPAHAAFPTVYIKFGESSSAKLGSQKEANQRMLHRYIHTNGVKSAQLVMGLTELDEGSIWNTMPAHTHQRRTEIYFYFNLDDKSVVFHMMGQPAETRHIVVRDEQVVVSPSWSIHAGGGTTNYSFIWSMGGENQEFEDMDSVDMSTLK